jgi:hypothetical protein
MPICHDCGNRIRFNKEEIVYIMKVIGFSESEQVILYKSMDKQERIYKKVIEKLGNYF